MKLLNKITNFYLFFILIIFVLIVDGSGYANILNFKWNIYVYVSTIYIVAMLIITMLKILNKTIDIKQFSFNKVYIFALIYLVVIIISTLLSPYKNYNLLIGSARMQGLIVNTIYVISFIIVSLTYKFNKNILYVLLIPSIIMGIMIMLQKLGFNPLYLYKLGGSTIFYGTIGNIDTVGLLYTMYLTIGILLFMFSNLNKIFLYLSITMSVIVMFIINTTGMSFTLFLTLIILIPYAHLKNDYLRKYLLVVLAILSIMLLFNYNTIYLLVAIFIILIIYILFKHNYNCICKRNIINSYIVLFITIVIAIFLLYRIDFKNGLLYEFHNIMHGNFDDSFGTYRMFLWKRTLKMINIKYVILGTGIDTYYISFMKNYINDLIKNGSVTINDTACNFYLTMIINIGVVGLLSFLVFIESIISLIKYNKNVISIILLSGIISYLVQGMFNLEVVLVTPIFYALLSLYISSLKRY